MRRFKSQYLQNKKELSQFKRKLMGWNMAQVIESLPGKHEALNSNPSRLD
jgi:hypothetical protein